RVVEVVPAGPRRHFSRASMGSGATAALNLSETEIIDVQRVLIDRGLLTGKADGVLTERTRQALITFQRQQGIQATGSIDTRTVTALGISDKIGQSTNQGQSSTVGQGTGAQQPNASQTTTGQGTGQPNAQAPQNQPTAQA